MSWTMEFFHKAISGFILALLMMISHCEGICRHLSINSILPGKVLVNHTVDRIQPIERSLCSSKCYLEPLCFSYNVCQDHINGSLCELLDSDHIRHGEHLVEKAGCTYYGSETSCSSNPCANNATCQGDFSVEKRPYRCVCPRGFTGPNCEIDNDECLIGNHLCHVNATCTNVIGGYNCTCKKGFYGDGIQCNDEDECTKGTHECHVNATCSNMIGGYNCTCKKGFYGDGIQCNDEDKCTKGTHECHVNATCSNMIGGYNCSCKKGFYGDGKQCNDYDECTKSTHDCHVNAKCSNVIGGYRCTCKPGFFGNGSFCRRPKSCEDFKLLLPRNTSNGVYEHELVGGGVGKVFCSFESYSECGAGPWTLAMKIDGSKKNFEYDSVHWSQKSVFNPDGSVGGLDGEETVSPAYWTTSLTKLCLGMRYGNALNWILINYTASSLHDVMTNQSEVRTQLGETKWRSMLPSTSLEPNCDMEGFNLRCEKESLKRRLRLGFFTNNEADCSSCQSYIGMGPMVKERDVAPSCGNHAVGGADHGSQNHAAFCYLLIR